MIELTFLGHENHGNLRQGGQKFGLRFVKPPHHSAEKQPEVKTADS